jgi:RNA polymerase sigma-70 factor (ECF subfamily)
MTLKPLAFKADTMLLSNHKKFDEAALEVLFKENFGPLCTFCQHKFGFALDVAKDAAHSGFIKLWENRENISPDLSLKAYIYKIVSNISLDMLRHDKVRQNYTRQILQNAPIPATLKDFNDAELKQLMADIDTAINELPEQMRKIFELSRYQGLKYAEISSQLNISVKTVETQMSRALVKLRQKLSQYLALLIWMLLMGL